MKEKNSLRLLAASQIPEISFVEAVWQSVRPNYSNYAEDHSQNITVFDIADIYMTCTAIK